MAVLFFYLPTKQLFDTAHHEKLGGVPNLDLHDVEAAEKASAQIDQFIEKRSKEKEEADALEDMWRASDRRRRRKIRLANGHAWVEYFKHLASCHERRALEFRDRSREVSAMVEALADEAPGPEEEGEGVAAVS